MSPNVRIIPKTTLPMSLDHVDAVKSFFVPHFRGGSMLP